MVELAKNLCEHSQGWGYSNPVIGHDYEDGSIEVRWIKERVCIILDTEELLHMGSPR